MVYQSSKNLVLAIGVSIALSGCASSVSVDTDFNPKVDFTSYKTFAWIKADPLISAPSDFNPLNKPRIESAVVRVMTEKGFTQVTDGSAADFVVAYTVGTRDKIRVDQSYPSHYGSRWGWGGRYWGYASYNDTHVRNYTEGRLAIDIFDVARAEPAWHGFATKNVTSKDRQNPAPIINEAVEGILAKFPPY